jgi:hypothetical protein
MDVQSKVLTVSNGYGPQAQEEIMKLKFSPQELSALGAVLSISALANLPAGYGADWIDRKLLLGVLATIVVIAMFRYLQVVLLLIISLLAIGANLPQSMAEHFGVSQPVLLAVLGLLIGMTLVNRMLNLLPEYDEPPEDVDVRAMTQVNEQGARLLMMEAIAHGKVALVRELIENKVEVNFVIHGHTPLHLATEKGYPSIVQLLIDNGADLLAQDVHGNTALDLALALKKFARTTDILYTATIPLLTSPQEV